MRNEQKPMAVSKTRSQSRLVKACTSSEGGRLLRATRALSGLGTVLVCLTKPTWDAYFLSLTASRGYACMQTSSPMLYTYSNYGDPEGNLALA